MAGRLKTGPGTLGGSGVCGSRGGLLGFFRVRAKGCRQVKSNSVLPCVFLLIVVNVLPIIDRYVQTNPHSTIMGIFHRYSFNQLNFRKSKGLIPPDALRQRYGCGTSWPRSPQQIGSTLINETISTGRGCGTSQQHPRSGSPRRSAIIP